MEILLIGGTGNICAESAALLNQRGHEILVVSRGRSAVSPQYRTIRADRKDLAAMRAALHGVQPDVVINFLGYELADVEVDYELFKNVVRQYIFRLIPASSTTRRSNNSTRPAAWHKPNPKMTETNAQK